MFSGCGTDLQVYVEGQGLEGLGPLRRSKVEGARRLQRHQNPGDWDRMHLETRRNIQESRQTQFIINFLIQVPLKKITNSINSKVELSFASKFNLEYS